MKKSPNNQLQAISTVLSEKGSGWRGPKVNNTGIYNANWKLYVGEVSYGAVRFVKQPVKGKTLFKVAYECPYESLFNSYVTDITDIGGELVDNFNDADGGQNSVYQRKGYVFILTRYPASLKRYWIEGLPTGYFKVLMHESVE